jgi:TonB family protein
VGKLKLAVLLAVAAAPAPARAEPPFINMVFPPAGFVGPREDPAFPHDPPAYPDHATQCQESGTAKVVLTIAADGRVSDATITQSTGFADLDVAIGIQVRKWRYLPATKEGRPTAVRTSIMIPLTPEKHGPNFAADCTQGGVAAAAEALLRSARKFETKN